MKYKTAFYSFYLPVALAMYMVRRGGEGEGGKESSRTSGLIPPRLASKIPRSMLQPNPFYWKWESSFKSK